MLDNKSCLERIREVYSSLNAKEQKVAKYILDNTEDIVHFSITELADCSSVSDATVFRLCNKLGYKGYQDLKINLACAVVKPMENIHEEINENDNMYIIIQKLLTANEFSLENTVKINSDENLEKAVNLILNSGEIIFYGMGGSGSLAYDAYHKFVRTGIRCVVNTDSHWQAMISSMAKKNDVIIAFSNSGSNKELIESMKIGIKNGVKVISITGNAKSPISKVSDVVLVSYGKESNFRSEAMESRLSALMLIDALYVGVAIKRKKETLENLEKIREGIAEKRY
ncbi:DNA-binding MurR/RpiR family transcriptional regulator [Clostridium algifaecis]|uniref:DNA-binding MurR/RpiR family transcriptional regulator n=1 Tax=Clostridium algifaecis TaxID=1472040 RepID=A0ABS4KQF5_9CLOT|nr:DNA-binding MurR/RpiR family transcriptional regulator [Clostridium algifaecis]